MVSEKPTVSCHFAFFNMAFFSHIKMRPGYYSEDLIILFEYTDPSIFAVQFGQWELL